MLVVDEPFVGLDSNGRDELLALFDDVHASGKTVLVATHELITVAASAARSRVSMTTAIIAPTAPATRAP